MKNIITENLGSLCLLVFLSTTTFSCHLNKDIKPNADSLLINCWKHAYEEETPGDLKVYRPCDFMEFPPSRYRSTYIFKDNNACDYLELSPNDAHFFSTGRWEYNAETGILLIKDKNDMVLTTFAVVELAADKLVVRED